MGASIPTVKLLINGQFVESTTTQWRDVVNPATQEVLAEVAEGGAGEVDAAVRAAKVMHGKTSQIRHDDQGLFSGLRNPLTVTRYHSLIVEAATLPAALEVTAWSLPDERNLVSEIMGVRHRQLPIVGVQFHPESILSEQGMELLANFVALR